LSTSELILYLTPEGQLGDQCAQFFRDSARSLGVTTAHSYPSHVTLTGFFRRAPERLDEIRSELGGILAEPRLAPPEAVEILGLVRTAAWVGLEVRSAWAHELTSTIVDRHRVLAGEDALRPKDWLHLSLAYGLCEDQQLDDFVSMAEAIVDPAAAVEWRVGLWERVADGSWHRHEI